MKHIILALLLILPFFAAHAQQETVSFTEDFSDSILKNFRYGSTGNKTDFKFKAGVKSESDRLAKVLSFRLDPSDSARPGRGPEIISDQSTHFGTYSARLKIPSVKNIQPNVGAVVGYFTYNEDSIHGLSEIDFEWLVADPAIIYIGTWTGEPGKLKRVGRTIDLAKGLIYYTKHREDFRKSDTALTGAFNQPETIPAVAGYDASARFYTYGFDWQANQLRWWMIDPATGEKIILWDYKNATVGIPQYHSYYRMNFWHTDSWSVETNPKSIEKPVHPFELQVDWMSYKAINRPVR
jgi:beta-glucanase (GH16 family)